MVLRGTPEHCLSALMTCHLRSSYHHIHCSLFRWVYSGTLGTISVATIMGVGIAFKIDFFMYTDTSLAFAILLLFVGAMIAYAFALASVIPSTFMAMMYVLFSSLPQFRPSGPSYN